QERLKAERRRQQRAEALEGLQEVLGLDALPLRIECFDVSHLMGTEQVASMVVFEGGAPKKSDYRRFRVRENVEGRSDDFAASAGRCAWPTTRRSSSCSSACATRRTGSRSRTTALGATAR